MACFGLRLNNDKIRVLIDIKTVPLDMCLPFLGALLGFFCLQSRPRRCPARRFCPLEAVHLDRVVTLGRMDNFLSLFGKTFHLENLKK